MMNDAMEDYQEQQILQMQIEEIEANTRRQKKNKKHGITVMDGDGQPKEEGLADKFFSLFGCGPKRKPQDK